MKLKKFNLFSLLILLFIVASCQQENEETPQTNTKRPIQLVAEKEAMSRVSGDSWDEEDKIGIFGKESGQSLTEGLLPNELLNNREFITLEGNGVFTTSEIIFYPEEVSSLDLIGYYPYQTSIKNFLYKINLENQSTPSAIDLLYADNVKGLSTETTVRPTLFFKRQLAKLDLAIYPEGKEGVLNLDRLKKVELVGLPTTADFSLETGLISNLGNIKSVELFPYFVDNHLIVEALLIPGADLTAAKVVITTTEDVVYRLPLKGNIEADQLVKAENYRLEVQLSGLKGEEEKEPEPGKTEGFTEWPDVSNAIFSDGEIKVSYLSTTTSRAAGAPTRNFTVYYDVKYKLSHWVAYPLHPYYTKKNVKRTNRWQYDPNYSSKDQPNLSKAWDDYKKLEYDRGHQIASADRLVSREANEQTFYYTNMTAQKKDLNQKKWANLEDQVRTWSDRAVKPGYDTLFVVTGAIIPTPPEKITWAKDKFGGQAAVPTSYYKVLLQKKDGKAYTIGFELENKDCPKPLASYQKTVADIEKKTGFVFFPTISQSDKEVIDRQFWTY